MTPREGSPEAAPPRVMLVIEHLQCGGTERQLHHLAVGMQSRGITVEACCFRSRGPFGESLQGRGIPVHLVRKRYKIDPTLPWRLARLFRERRSEVVHLFLFTACLWGGLGARLARVPAVIATDRSINHLEFRSRPLVVTLFRLATRRLHDRVLGNSQQVSRYLQRALKIAPERVATVANGIDTDNMRPLRTRDEVRSELGIHQTTPVMLMVGRLVWQKNYPLLLGVARRLAANFPDLVTVVAGDGPLLEEMIACARSLGVFERIRFLGARDDVLDLMAAADMVVLTSDVEGFPNTLLEAMWVGRPTVSTDAGGIGEVVVDGETGLVVATGDERAFAAAVGELLNDPARAERMGELAHERVLGLYTAQRMTESTLAQYAVALRARGRAQRAHAFEVAHG